MTNLIPFNPSPTRDRRKKVGDVENSTLNKLLATELACRNVSKLLRGDDDLDLRLSDLCKALCDSLKSDAASIYLSVGSEWMKAHHASAELGRDELDFITTFEGFKDISSMTETGTFINDISGLTLLINGRNAIVGELPGSAATIGVYKGSNWVGYISAMDFSPGRKWNNSDEHLLANTAEELSLARERYQTLERLKAANEMTTRKAEELEKALVREKELNTLQAEFIATASHEFKTPLAIIDSSAQLLKSTKVNDENYLLRQVEKIRGAVKRMSYLVEKTLDLSAVEAGNVGFEPKAINVVPLVKEICGRFSDLYPEWEIVPSMPQSEVVIRADEKLLDQVLSNIIGNALKYSPPESEVRVKLAIEGQNVAIYISDEGIGIHQDDLARMFGKFARGRNTTHAPGTGIGLYISEKFIRMMGGWVWISSEVDKGTTVKITLPAAFSSAL